MPYEVSEMSKTDVSYAVWAWMDKTEVRCSNCKSLVGVAFCEESYEELAIENKFCYNCGFRMFSLKNMISAIVEGVVYEKDEDGTCLA